MLVIHLIPEVCEMCPVCRELSQHSPASASLTLDKGLRLNSINGATTTYNKRWFCTNYLPGTGPSFLKLFLIESSQQPGFCHHLEGQEAKVQRERDLPRPRRSHQPLVPSSLCDSSLPTVLSAHTR